MRTVIAAVFAAAVLGTAVAPVRSAPMAVQIAQGNSSATRNRALSSYASGNSKLRKGDIAGARRDLETAIAAETRYFATLGSERRQGEASYLVEYLTLGGITEYRSASHAAALKYWKAAGDLYRTYLPVLNRRLASGDALLANGSCVRAFDSYSGTLGRLAPEILPTLRAAAGGLWSDAQGRIADARGTTAGDLVYGMLALCHPRNLATAQAALVAALTDYEPTTSATPNTGPLQASSIRLVLLACGRGLNPPHRRPKSGAVERATLHSG